MLRVTVLGLALAISVAACSKKEGASNADTAMGGMPPAGAESTTTPAGTDTMGAMTPDSTATTSAAGAIDTMTSRAGAAVDTMAQKTGQMADEAKAAAAAGAAAVGDAASSVALRTKLAALSSDQVKQLQTALNNDGCDVGTADGTMGKKTREGVQCSMRKHNISDSDVDSLYKTLNLDFQ